MNGLLWSHSISTNTGGITLNTESAMEGFRDLWASKNYNLAAQLACARETTMYLGGGSSNICNRKTTVTMKTDSAWSKH